MGRRLVYQLPRRAVAAPPAPERTPQRGGSPLSGRRGARDADRLPEHAAVEVFGTDPDGDPLARPVDWHGGSPPIVFMRPERRGQAALAPGDRVLARLRRIGRHRYEGSTLKRLPAESGSRVLGVLDGERLRPADRRDRADWVVPAAERHGALDGELVLARPLPGGGLGLRPARVVERLGRLDDARAVSALCIRAHDIPDAFPEAALREAAAAGPVPPAGREDLRGVPLVTIDGDDARDFDDAVFAAAADGGWRLLVAIADVAHYVRPGTALDREARRRGNSTYFPDRVVPMLPEALSNGWCSLRPDEDRGCLFAEIRLDGDGLVTGHRFGRGLMRSSARLRYESVQAEHEADPTRHAALFGAFRALATARARRGTLELDLPERRMLLDEGGRVASVRPRPRLDSHRLIEEFMVAANVCAAETLERLRRPFPFRVHDRPADRELESLRPFLDSLELSLPPAAALRPRHLASVLESMRGRSEERLAHEAVLRAQSRAEYAPDNIGHFGLALPRYCHFTSPIRRYADLLVHRALLDGLGLGGDGAGDGARLTACLAEDCAHVTGTERRSARAERDAVERYLAAHMADRVGAHFEARVSGVTRQGLFVTLDENGASGIVPLAALPDDRWVHDEVARQLSGARTRLRFSPGQPVEVRLDEATPLTGALRFALLQGDPRPAVGRRAARRG